jgi:hypothetical protein
MKEQHMSSELPYPSDVPPPDENQFPADPWNPLAVAKGGSPVAVRWAGDLWLHAVAISSSDEQCEILLADDSTLALPRASIVAVPLRPVFQAGHEVMARWRNAAMFPGTITAASPQSYTVAWHDGDAPLAVPLGALTFLEWCQETRPAFGAPDLPQELAPPIIPAPEITPGSWAAIRSRTGYWIAQVEAEAQGGFKVRFTDGATASVPDADVIPIPAEGVFDLGDQVLALWKGGNMFPGTITEESPEGYTVAWHDGDTPIVVRPGMLTYLFWVMEGTR